MDHIKNAPVTACVAGSSFTMSVLKYFDILTPIDLYLSKYLIFEKHQYWRVITSMLYTGELGFNSIINLYMLVQYSARIESKIFIDMTQEFIIFIIFGMFLIVIESMMADQLFMIESLISFAVYYWSKHCGDLKITVAYIPMPILTAYLPFIQIGLCIYEENYSSLKSKVIGFIAAQITFFIRDVVGAKYDVHLLNGPSIPKDKNTEGKIETHVED